MSTPQQRNALRLAGWILLAGFALGVIVTTMFAVIVTKGL